MHSTFRQIVIATTAIIGLSTVAYAAAPVPAAGDPTATRPSTATNGAPVTKVQSGAGHSIASKIDQRIADLHAKLLISPAQQPQWDLFAQVMRDNAQSMEQTFQHRAQTMPTMTATENMQSYAEVATAHAQDVQKLVPAFQALYGSMSDNQKRTADQVFRDDAHHGDRPRHS